jgi:hypothetical protein
LKIFGYVLPGSGPAIIVGAGSGSAFTKRLDPNQYHVNGNPDPDSHMLNADPENKYRYSYLAGTGGSVL